MDLCLRCKVNPVERIDDWVSELCCRCNDVEIDRSNRTREWEHYHPGTRIPESEL